MKLIRIRPRNKLSQLGRYERKVMDRTNEGREISEEEVLQAILSVPAHYIVGPFASADGGSPAARQSKSGGTVVSPEGGKYYELASRGQLFSACDQAAGVAVASLTLSTTATLVLYNPQASGRRLSVMKTSLIYFNGTLGTGVLFHCMNYSTTQTAPSGGTALGTNTLGFGGTASGQARVAATVVAPVAVFPLAYLSPELASSVTAPQFGDQEIDGAFIVEQGQSYQIQGVTAAGTSPKMSPGIIWGEFPQI